MNINDFIKRSILELDTFANFSIINMLISLTLTLVITLVIFYVYKITYRGVVYNHNFNISLLLLSLVTSMIIMAISSNVILSLGMVGALSIVRFRAAIKDPRDLVFMFWAIAIGISCGAGMYALAIVGTSFISVVLLVMTRSKYVQTSYLLIIKYDKIAKAEVDKILNQVKYTLKSKVVSKQNVEITVELKKLGKNIVNTEYITSIEGVNSAVIVKYTGDYID